MTARRAHRHDRFGDDNVDPMNSLSNLADVMLIFAIGALVALATYWQLDIAPGTAKGEANTSVTNDTRTFTEEEREQMRSDATEGKIGEGMQKTGEVYYDAETETYYIVEYGND